MRNYGNYASIIGKACYKGNKTTPQVAVFLDFTQWLQMSMGREQRLWPSKYKAPNPCLKHADFKNKPTSFNFPWFCSGLPETKTILLSKTQDQLPLHCRRGIRYIIN